MTYLRQPHAVALGDRARALGLTGRDVLAIASEDPRSLSDVLFSSVGAVARLQAWISHGRPDADPGDVLVLGDRDVARVVRSAVARMPAFGRWHTVRQVTVIACPRGVRGLQTLPPRLPAPDGDIPHMVLLDPRQPDGTIASTLAHEIGHSLCRDVFATPRPHRRAPEDEPTEYDDLRRDLGDDGAAQFCGELVEAQVLGEILADEIARSWGFPIDATRQQDRRIARRTLGLPEETSR